MANKKEKTDVRDVIIDDLKLRGVTLGWLARMSGINYNSIFAMFKKKDYDVSEENMLLINVAMGTNYEVNKISQPQA